MELKDLVKDVIDEMSQEDVEQERLKEQNEQTQTTKTQSLQAQVAQEDIKPQEQPQKQVSAEAEFLDGLKERLLVLFEGLHSPTLKDKENKLDLTINFLEYALAQIDNRLDEIA